MSVLVAVVQLGLLQLLHTNAPCAGASVGAVVSRFSTFLWRPLVVKLVPELEEHGLMDWVDLTVAGGFGAGAAWIRFACQTFF